MDYLLDNGANINIKNTDGTTPLMIASTYNQFEIVKLLVQRSADINAKDNDGNTAIFYAEEYGNEEVVTFLRDQGA